MPTNPTFVAPDPTCVSPLGMPDLAPFFPTSGLGHHS